MGREGRNKERLKTMIQHHRWREEEKRRRRRKQKKSFRALAR